MLKIAVTNTTPLDLLVAMRKWCEARNAFDDAVLLHRFFPVVYNDKDQKNSLHSLFGEIGVWNLQR